MTTSTPHNATEMLGKLGLALPVAPKPVASYVPAVRTGKLLFISGQLPFRDGKLIATGKVPSVVSIEMAQECARQCVLNGLAVVAAECGGTLSQVSRIVRLGVFVACDDGFSDQPKVANGASDLLQQIFGDAGRHARAAVGTNALPLNACIEVEMMVELF
ncbi:MAG: RidA family protein [Planctomycetota bacterium]|nr:RidA family protein [Planctomycetota bacterium]MDA1262239.1 RidA family protein [Planctomycetota bacterium]